MARALPIAQRHNVRRAGFTLIELLVALAILAIVSAVAVPLYTTYAERSFRAEAMADLLNCAQGMERLSAQSFDYRDGADTDNDGAGDADAGAIAANVCRPRSVDQGRYNITVNGDDAGFTLTAVPIGTQAGDGLLSVNEAGDRRWDRNDDGDTTDANEDSWEE